MNRRFMERVLCPSPRRDTPHPSRIALRLMRAPSPTMREGKKVDATLDLPQLDLVGDLMGQVDAADGENHFGREFFVALEAAARDRVAHRLLDFALRGD